jgi:hypothetical protein
VGTATQAGKLRLTLLHTTAQHGAQNKTMCGYAKWTEAKQAAADDVILTHVVLSSL